MAVKNFLSAIESRQHYEACLQSGAKHVLTSYFQFYTKDKDFVRRRKQKNPDMNFLCDSGAHTVISDYGKFANWSLKDFEKYVVEYCEWLSKNREYLFAAVEFDIDYTLNMLFGGGEASTFGTSVVEGWQKKYFAPLESKGLPIIYVWHKERGLQGWEEMCSKHSYVGLPGEMSSDTDFNKYITVARRYTTRIHGFGCSKQADFRDWPWYSQDSTTWKSAEMYGTLIHWDKQKQILIFDPVKANRGKYRRSFEEHGLDAEGIIQDKNYKEVTKYALISMTAMEHFYARKYADRVFYYELRLPHVGFIKFKMEKAEVFEWWKKFRPDQLFKDHSKEILSRKIREYLIGLSAIQNQTPQVLSQHPEAQKFLEHYFSKLMLPQMADIVLFQKELSNFVAPPNPPPLPRLDMTHYEALNNPPKKREEDKFELEDLEHDLAAIPLSESEI